MPTQKYNPATDKYEEAKKIKPELMRPSGAGAPPKDDLRAPNVNQMNSGSVGDNVSGEAYPTTFDPYGGNPNVTPYKGVDPSQNVNRQYVDELKTLEGDIPGIYGKTVGTSSGVPKVSAPKITDVGYSRDYKDFSKTLNQSMLDEMGRERFGQQDINTAVDFQNQQMQQERTAMEQQAQAEGRDGTPEFAKQIRDMEMKYNLMNAKTGLDYRQAEAQYSLNQKQMVTGYFRAFTDAENTNRQIKLQTGRINADKAFKAAQANASRASAAIMRNMQGKLREYQMKRQGVFDRAKLDAMGRQEDFSIERYNAQRADNNYWSGVNQRMEKWGFQKGLEAGERQSQREADTQKWQAENTGGLFGAGGFLGTGIF